MNKYNFLIIVIIIQLALMSCSSTDQLWNQDRLDNYESKMSPEDSLYTMAIDSLVPIKYNPYYEEVSYRVRQETFNYKEYSFIFTRNIKRSPITKVIISEAIDNSIYTQLSKLYKDNRALHFNQALQKIKVQHKILTSDKYPLLDSLMSSIYQKSYKFKSNNDSIVYLDPAWSEIRVKTFQSEVKIGMIGDSTLIEWAEGIRSRLNELK